MSSATVISSEVILHPADYPEIAAKVWCRVLSANVVVHCDRCQRVTNAAHAGDVCFGFYCSACCPACRTTPTDADREVMARNVEFAGWGAEGGRPKKPKVKIQRIETMRYSVRSLTAAVSVPRLKRVAKERQPGLPLPLKPFMREPKPKRIRSVRALSKVAQYIDLLARPQGATMDELGALFGLSAYAVKAILSWDVSQVGYGYVSEDGVTVRLLLPEGMSGPLAHRADAVRDRTKKPTAKRYS